MNRLGSGKTLRQPAPAIPAADAADDGVDVVRHLLPDGLSEDLVDAVAGGKDPGDRGAGGG